jgi:hypothetical protein
MTRWTLVDEFAALLARYKIVTVTGDRFGGEWCREPFRQRGIAYALADRPKSDLYRDALPALNAGTVELLDHPRLVAQLCGLERRTARGGRDAIDHPPRGHDDVANAVVGALLGATAPSPTLQIYVGQGRSPDAGWRPVDAVAAIFARGE